MEENGEKNTAFTLSLPLVGRDLTLTHTITSAHMDPVIHMLFLREQFALSIWDKYMEHIFYDEFLAHMVLLMLDRQEEKSPESLKQLQTIYQTVYMRTKEKHILREVERIVTEGGADRISTLRILREELDTRIASGGEERLLRLRESVDHLLAKEVSVQRAEITNLTYRTSDMSEVEAAGDSIAGGQLAFPETEGPRSTDDRQESETVVYLMEHIREQIERELDAVEEKKETVFSEEVTHRTDVMSVDETERQVVRETILHVLDRIESGENPDDILSHRASTQEGMARGAFNDEEKVTMTNLLHRIREQVETELSETVTLESDVRKSDTTRRVDGKPVGEEVDRSVRETITRVLNRIEESEKWERTNRDATTRTPEGKNIDRATRIPEGKNIDRATLIMEEKNIGRATRIPEERNRSQASLTSEEKTYPRQAKATLLHRIHEQVERELSGDMLSEAGESKVNVITETEKQVIRETIARVLSRMEESVHPEEMDSSPGGLTPGGEMSVPEENYVTMPGLLYRVREQVETELSADNTIRVDVRETITQLLNRIEHREIRVFEESEERRETIRHMINRIEGEMTYEWQDVERLTLATPLRGLAVPTAPALTLADAGETRGADFSDDSSGTGTDVMSSEVIRELDDVISEIREREGEEETVIMELKNDLQKAVEEIREIKTQTAESEAARDEEERDAHQEEKVTELFDNSLQLERLRKGY